MTVVIFFYFCYLLHVTQKRTQILKHHDVGNYIDRRLDITRHRVSRLTAEGSSLLISDGAIF